MQYLDSSWTISPTEADLVQTEKAIAKEIGDAEARSPPDRRRRAQVRNAHGVLRDRVATRDGHGANQRRLQTAARRRSTLRLPSRRIRHLPDFWESEQTGTKSPWYSMLPWDAICHLPRLVIVSESSMPGNVPAGRKSCCCRGPKCTGCELEGRRQVTRNFNNLSHSMQGPRARARVHS